MQRSDLATATIIYRRASLEEIVDLRHAVLRAGLPREAAVFAGDEAEASRHFGAFDGATVVGCATLHANSWEGEPAWQLRGMASDPGYRGRGVGRGLLRFLEGDIADAGMRLLWCNARVPAAGFYEAMGWSVRSDAFDIPTAGPHYRMVKRL